MTQQQKKFTRSISRVSSLINLQSTLLAFALNPIFVTLAFRRSHKPHQIAYEWCWEPPQEEEEEKGSFPKYSSFDIPRAILFTIPKLFSRLPTRCYYHLSSAFLIRIHLYRPSTSLSADNSNRSSSYTSSFWISASRRR